MNTPERVRLSPSADAGVIAAVGGHIFTSVAIVIHAGKTKNVGVVRVWVYLDSNPLGMVANCEGANSIRPQYKIVKVQFKIWLHIIITIQAVAMHKLAKECPHSVVKGNRRFCQKRSSPVFIHFFISH